MKLKTCQDIGQECGFVTIASCYENIHFHATSLFRYEDIGKELLELQKDIFWYHPDLFCHIFACDKEKLLKKGWKTKGC